MTPVQSAARELEAGVGIRCHMSVAFDCWLLLLFGGQIVGDGGAN